MIKKFSEMLNENNHEDIHYMFFQNLKQMKGQIEELLLMDDGEVDNILIEHDWASDHISTAKDNVEDVYNFLKNKE